MIELVEDTYTIVSAGNYIIPWENTQSGNTISTAITTDKELPYNEFIQEVKDFLRETFTSDHALGKFDKIKLDELVKTIAYQPRVKIIPLSEEREINIFLGLGYSVVEYKENWCILEKTQQSSDAIIK